MRRTLLFTAALGTAVGLFALGEAQAAPDPGPAMAGPAQRMPPAGLLAKPQARGCTLPGTGREGGRQWNIRARDGNGMVVAAYPEPAAGAPATRAGREDQ
jgi:hypothetical protein